MGKSDGYDKNAPWCVPIIRAAAAFSPSRRIQPSLVNQIRRPVHPSNSHPASNSPPPLLPPPAPSSPLGTGTRLITVGGELVAVAHRIKPTGYKAPNAYGNRVAFDGTTTSGSEQAKVRVVGSGEGPKKKLMPYHPLASRNRPKSQTDNATSGRFTMPKGSVEAYRNASQVNLTDGHPDSGRAGSWRTTNQEYSDKSATTGVVGLANQGIFAEAAILTHKKQRK